MELELLKPFLSAPLEEARNVKITQALPFFTLKEYKGNLTRRKYHFLKNLYAYALPEYRINQKSAVYFFKSGESVIELDVTIDKDIHIKPFFHYDEKKVKKDFYRVMELDYLLHCVLKLNELQ